MEGALEVAHGLEGTQDGLFHPDDARQVEDHLVIMDEPPDERQIEGAAPNTLDVRMLEFRGFERRIGTGEIVEDRELIAPGCQRMRDMPAQEPRPTRHEDAHTMPFGAPTPRIARCAFLV